MTMTQGNVTSERTERKRRGYFCLPRGIMARFRHQGPLTEFEAVAWLVEHAAFTERDVNGVRVQPGEQVFTWHGLARAWAWTKPRAMRFVRRLERDGLVRVEAYPPPYPQAYRLTLCEPLLISGSRTPDRTPHRTPSEERLLKQDSEQEQTNQTNGADAPVHPVASNVVEHPRRRTANGQPYAFEGRYIRLTESDFAAWERANPHLDLRSELQVREDWYRENPHEHGRDWYIRTSQWLAKRNRRAKVEAAQPTTAQSRGRSGGVIAGSAEWWETTGTLMGYTLPPGEVPPPSAAIEAGTARPVYAARGTAQ